MRVLVFGIGNPGRQDDSLGPRLVENLQADENRFPHEMSFDANYQLNVEDAEAISHCDVVVFVDASVDENDEPFRLSRLDPEPTASFSTHSVSAGGVLALCNQMYERFPAVYLMAIRGYAWEVNAEITRRARVNLEAAVQFLSDALSHDRGDCGEKHSSLLDAFVS